MFDVPDNYWEPEPDEEDLARMEAEYRAQHPNWEEELEDLPF